MDPVPGESSSGPGGSVKKGILDTIKTWWYTRVQGDLAIFFGTLAVIDFTPYADDLNDLIPWKHWKSAIRLTGAAAIWWRATQARRSSQ